MTEPEAISRDVTSMLSALASGPLHVGEMKEGKFTLTSGAGDHYTLSGETLASLVTQGLVNRIGSAIKLSVDGLSAAKRMLATEDRFRARHRELAQRSIVVDGALQSVIVNLAESPLANLMRRKGRDGRPFLSGEEFEAGETLRHDYERAGIMPRLTANWEAPISTGKRAKLSNDITDGAIAARARVDKAVEAVGPELSGVLIDVCCFLKGLEVVETERQWPSRSGKMLLKAALGSLARHYRPPARGRKSPILSWGADGYRPRLGS